jgi:hypothetical protein
METQVTPTPSRHQGRPHSPLKPGGEEGDPSPREQLTATAGPGESRRIKRADQAEARQNAAFGGTTTLRDDHSAPFEEDFGAVFAADI